MNLPYDGTCIAAVTIVGPTALAFYFPRYDVISAQYFVGPWGEPDTSELADSLRRMVPDWVAIEAVDVDGRDDFAGVFDAITCLKRPTAIVPRSAWRKHFGLHEDASDRDVQARALSIWPERRKLLMKTGLAAAALVARYGSVRIGARR